MAFIHKLIHKTVPVRRCGWTLGQVLNQEQMESGWILVLLETFLVLHVPKEPSGRTDCDVVALQQVLARSSGDPIQRVQVVLGAGPPAGSHDAEET